MADAKITELSELTSVDNADLLVIVDDVAGTATTKKVSVSNLLAVVGSLGGWNSITGTFTYNSATSLNVSSVAASIYKKGDRLRYQNNDSGTYLYNYIIGIADTLLTVVGDTVPNATLTDNYYSNYSAIGFPDYFNYTPTGPNNTTLTGRFSINGRTLTGWMKGSLTGACTFASWPTLPVASANCPSNTMFVGYYVDSGVAMRAGKLVGDISTGTTMTLFNGESTSGDMPTYTSSVPITWANGDHWGLPFFYEI